MAAAVLCASVLLTVHAQAQAPNNSDPPATPFLRVDAGMHTAEITDLAVDGQAALIATASTDKTVRLWHADDGSPVTTLRVPIAPGAEGEINAVAVAPDGKHVLAGGATGFSFGPGFSLYLFDTDKQAMIGRLAGLPTSPMRQAAKASRLALRRRTGSGSMTAAASCSPRTAITASASARSLSPPTTASPSAPMTARSGFTMPPAIASQ